MHCISFVWHLCICAVQHHQSVDDIFIQTHPSLYCPCSSSRHSPKHCKTFQVWQESLSVTILFCVWQPILVINIIHWTHHYLIRPKGNGGSQMFIQRFPPLFYIPRLKLLSKQTANPGRPSGCGLGSSSQVGDHLIPLPNLLCLVWSHKHKKRG